MKVFKKIFSFFDKLEDRIRFRLSRRPVLYALIGAIGIILVWKGVWETAAYFPLLSGPLSFFLGLIILLSTGLLVSFFVGDRIILSGFKREKKLAEKTEQEIVSEKDLLKEIAAKVGQIEHDIKEIHD
jgi:hypothetical protein